MQTKILHQKDGKAMETFFGKVTLAMSWLLAITTGQVLLWILSAIPSIMAMIFWYIKINKELRDDEDNRKV